MSCISQIKSPLEDYLPRILYNRWNTLRKQLYSLASRHKKSELISYLFELREKYTTIPTLTVITKFTGYDVAIHRISKWKWKPTKTGNLQADAEQIGLIGAELMVIHAISESVKHNLFVIEGDKIVETTEGKKHFETVNSYNVEVTGSRMDVARKRFSIERQTKYSRELDPKYRIPTVRKLYWDNTILMILRSPLTFYRAMKKMEEDEQKMLLKFHAKLMQKNETNRSGVRVVRVSKYSKITSVLEKLMINPNEDDSRPQFYAGRKKYSENPDKAEFEIGIGALTMFIIFMSGFDKEHLNDKAFRAEEAVRDIIESSGYWEVVETNSEITSEEGEALTEIDIVAKSKNSLETGEHAWVHCEVKDYSYWQGWIFGQNISKRRSYFEKAVGKLPIKEDFIRRKHQCSNLTSIIITSVPEVFDEVNGTKLVYLTDLFKTLAELENRKFAQVKSSTGGNFFLRYYGRYCKDEEQATNIKRKLEESKQRQREFKKKLVELKESYNDLRLVLSSVESSVRTIKVSEKLARRRLIKDDGSRHYRLEEDILKIQRDLQLKEKEYKRIKVKLLKKKEKYGEVKRFLENEEQKSKNYSTQISRQLAARSI